MDEKMKQELIDITPLESRSSQITSEILSQNELPKIKDLVDEFNLNQTKKNAFRIHQYSNLLDKISNEMEDRLTKNTDEFTNSDLLQYLQAIQSAMDKADKKLNGINDMNPSIVVNQINIENKETLDRDSRMKIQETVKAILAASSKIKEDIKDEIIVEPEEVDNNTETEE